MRARPLFRPLVPALLSVLGGCAASPWESRITTTMAPSATAAPTSRTDVTRSLSGDPPLPGETIDGWVGLTEADTDDAEPTRARSLDIDRAVRLAIEHDRELSARLAELGIARGRLRQAGVLPNPEIEAELLPERETRLEVAIEYDIRSLVLAPIRARAARADLEAARIEVAGYVVTLGFEVRRAYYELAAAEERLAIGQRMLDALAASRDAVEALYESGNVTALERAARISAYESARIEVASLELAVGDAREALVRRIGLHGAEAEFEVVPVFDAVSRELEVPDDLERRAIEASLELSAIRANLEALERRGRLARTEGRLPDIAVDVHLLEGHPAAPTGTAEQPSVRFGTGVRVGVPLFDRRQGVRDALAAELDAELARYDGAAIAIRSAARQASNHVRSAHARVRHFEQTLRRESSRVLEQTQLQYDAMQVDVFRLIAAHRDRQAVELAYVDTLREYAIARAAFDALLAGMRVERVMTARSPGSSSESDSEGGHG